MKSLLNINIINKAFSVLIYFILMLGSFYVISISDNFFRITLATLGFLFSTIGIIDKFSTLNSNNKT